MLELEPASRRAAGCVGEPTLELAPARRCVVERERECAGAGPSEPLPVGSGREREPVLELVLARRGVSCGESERAWWTGGV